MADYVDLTKSTNNNIQGGRCEARHAFVWHKDEVWVGVRINPQCTESPKKAEAMTGKASAAAVSNTEAKVRASGSGEKPQDRDAKRCIVLGASKNSQTLANSCNEEIEVVWCHDSESKGTNNARCGTEKMFYRQHYKLHPGEVKENRYSLPLRATIHYGACFGGYSTTQPVGNSGDYKCRVPKGARNIPPDQSMVQDLFRLIRESNQKDWQAQEAKVKALQARCSRDAASSACSELKTLYEQSKKNVGDIRG